MTRSFKNLLIVISVYLFCLSLQSFVLGTNFPRKTVLSTTTQKTTLPTSKTNLEGSPTENITLSETTEKMCNYANEFYQVLKNFDTLYMFGYFQDDFNFKENLIDCKDIEELEIATTCIKNATEMLKEQSQNQLPPINFEKVLNDDTATNLLNSVYNQLFKICNLSEKLKVNN